MENKKALSGKEKFAYGIGAVGKDMVYMLSASYILYYYQDIMGVSAWVMGVILLVARIFDAFNDPIMGVLVAKTKTKWGKFRPWLFIGTITNAIVLFVMFSCPPSLSGGGLVAYAAVFYILWGTTYTMMDIPYWSMVPAFTEGGKEREKLSSLARSCAGVGSAIITIITVIAVGVIGNIAAKHDNSNITTIVSSENNNLTTYIVERDDTGAETGNVILVTDQVTGKITAGDSEFEGDSIVHTESTSTCDFVIGKEKSDKYEYDLARDKDGEAALAIYVTEEEFAEISQLQDKSISFELESTKKVDRLGFKYFSLIVAILFVVFTIITCVCIKEKSTVDVQTAKVKDMFKALVANDQAMTMVIAIVLVNTATYITSNLLIYFFKYDLGGASWQGNYTLFNTVGGAVQILAMMLFFPLLRKWFSSMKIFFIAAASAVVGYVILLTLSLSGVSVLAPFLVPCFFIMAAAGMLNVLVTVFLANTVDYGELKNKRRDESVIFSMQTFVVKLASGIAALVASVCLSIFKISESDKTYSAVDGSMAKGLVKAIDKIKGSGAVEVSNNSLLGLRLTMTLIPIVVLLVAVVVFKKKYILTDEKLQEISEELSKN